MPASTDHPNYQSFEAFYEAEKGKLYAYARRIALQTRDDPSDLLADSIPRMLEGWSTFEGASHPMSWAFRILWNQSLNRIRARNRYTRRFHAAGPNSAAAISHSTSPLAATETQDLLEAIADRAKDLQQETLQIFYERFLSGLPIKDIAAKHHVSTKTVSTHLNLAITTFRNSLDPDRKDDSK